MEPKRGPTTALSLYDAWKIQLKLLSSKDQERFTILQSTLGELEPPHSYFDCIVSPANSYGLMDGGFDLYLSQALSPKGDVMALTRCAQAAIKERYYGFAPPGTCTLVQLPELLRQNPQYPRCRVLAVSPTMRYPIDVHWHKDLVYNTMWSLLTELEHWNEHAAEVDRIESVAMTGLATGVGGIDKELCACQMVLAIKHFLDTRSEEGQKRWAQEEFPQWRDVLPIAEEVVPEGK
ncbi:macro domain-like protein [Laetiporus sulphureus 93-53]|uniref:Macro domain-like protein n=1 Tax=Laetiporus sulphureus 93-53 TaxID=1314785 RepID=A0A165G3P9_9APHY|nr:macro domain-like protein [Laetiporus sulphureus 93-53]KZT09785.1 macro domain-like protein [Laetiporus sulphureus 93-53]